MKNTSDFLCKLLADNKLPTGKRNNKTKPPQIHPKRVCPDSSVRRPRSEVHPPRTLPGGVRRTLLGVSRPQSSQYLVPVCEVRCEVAVKLGVMQVVVRHAPKPPERYQSVRGPGEVVAGVVLHRQPDVDHVEGQGGERMAPQQQDVHHVKGTQGKELADAHVLRGQRERGRILMVHLVEGPVQPGHLVMEQMPHEELGVEEQQAEQHVARQLGQFGRLDGQGGRAQSPVQQRRGEHEHRVLQERPPEAGQQLPGRRREVWVDLVAPQRGHPGAQRVQHREGQAEAHVGGDGEEDGKEGRLNERLPGPQAVPERLQQWLARAAEAVELGAVVAAHGEAAASGAAAGILGLFSALSTRPP